MLGPNAKRLVVDEFKGFARSRVMLVLWIGLPLLGLATYFLPMALDLKAPNGQPIPMTQFIALLIASLAGTIAAIMVAVDIVSERNRGVYQLLVIRPLPPGAIVWAKFIAVAVTVTLACVAAIGTGIAVDLFRGADAIGWSSTGRALVSTIAVIVISTGVGVLIGTFSKSVLVAVILILYVGQNLAVIPMIPTYFGLAEYFWWFMASTAVLAVGVVLLAARSFRNAEL